MRVLVLEFEGFVDTQTFNVVDRAAVSRGGQHEPMVLRDELFGRSNVADAHAC